MKKKKTDKAKNADTKKDQPDKLQQQVETLQQENGELLEKLQRVSADYANYQKRAPKQISDTVTYEKERMIKSILPALDNFEHTLQNSKDAENADVVIKGVRIIYDQLLDILKSLGVERMKAAGQHFDPTLHQAMMKKHQPEEEDNIVLEEFQKGYKLNGRIVRPAMVIVNKIAEEKPPADEEAENDDDSE